MSEPVKSSCTTCTGGGGTHELDLMNGSLTMLTRYSSKAVVVLVIGYIIYDQNVFLDFEKDISVHNMYAPLLSRFFRTLTVAMLGLICYLKRNANSTEKNCKRLPNLQGLCLLLVTFILTVHGFLDMFVFHPDELVSSRLFLSQSGLRAAPMLTYIILRDTPFTTIFISWSVAIASLLFCAWKMGNVDRASAVVSYAFTTGLIYFDSYRRDSNMNRVVTQLQDALKMNEQLAIDAQALELRAMIGNVAHDLKTPLTSFLGGVECMTDVIETWETEAHLLWRPEHIDKAREGIEALKSCLSSMHSTNSFMTMTINRCLDYTKASKGFKLVPKFETVALKSALDMPTKMIRDAHSSIDIQTMTVSDEISSHIITDKQWLLENLLCLLSNAAKYSHKGCVHVNVTLEVSKVEKQLRFEIQDTGIGLSDEAMQGLFNPFKQAQRLAGGTGLGLFSLAKRVEALQGKYGVQQRPDGEQGCLFWFTIPYRPDEMSADLLKRSLKTPSLEREISPYYLGCQSTESVGPVEEFHSSSSSSFRATPRGPRYDVLVVDDAPLIVKMTTMLLQRKGHRVQHAVNGVDALEKLRVRVGTSDGGSTSVSMESVHKGSPGLQITIPGEAPSVPQFDVVLMDLQMPVMDGIEAIRRLRAAEKKRELRGEVVSPKFSIPVPTRQFVIALSANSDEETRQAALTAGADAFISKPFAYEAFQNVMHDGRFE